MVKRCRNCKRQFRKGHPVLTNRCCTFCGMVSENKGKQTFTWWEEYETPKTVKKIEPTEEKDKDMGVEDDDY